MSATGGEASDPLHSPSDAPVHWSRAQMAEALPGLQSPLNWSWWGPMGERALRHALADVHILSKRERRTPSVPSERMWSIFHGRPAANLDVLRRWADATPFLTGNALAKLMYNDTRRLPPRVSRSIGSSARILASEARHLLLLRQQLRRGRARCSAWWREVVDEPPRGFGSTQALEFLRGRLAGTYERLHPVAQRHALNNWLVTAAVFQLLELATACGREDLVDDILGGYGSFEETQLATDLWRIAEGILSVEDFVRTHGYHGPAEGEMSSKAWREDPAPITELARTYAGMDPDAHPSAAEHRRMRRRREAETKLARACGRRNRPQLALLLSLLARHVPLRQLGHNASTQMCDAARADVRRIGSVLAACGHLDDAEDVFLLTLDEVLADTPSSLDALVGFRRDARDAHRLVRLPNDWTGAPSISTAGDGAFAGLLAGVPASSGVVEGRAHVVDDANALSSFRAGDILICQTTDPSWSAFFAVAGGVVLDTGGRMSHGAIVAREFGLPCVTNTGTGTSVLLTGDHVRVDGDRGVVELLNRVPRVDGRAS